MPDQPGGHKPTRTPRRTPANPPPPPPPQKATAEAVRIEDLDDDARRPFHGLTNVVVTDELEIASVAAAIREFHTAVTEYMQVATRALRPFMEQIKHTHQALVDAALIDDQGKPTRPPDRPAWQSRYGPPARRRPR